MKPHLPTRWACGLAVLLSACGIASPTPASTRPPGLTPTPVGTIPTAQPIEPALELRVWLPGEFTPDGSTPGGRVLRAQLSEFEAAHPGLTIDIRIKRASGEGGLLDFLDTASAAAPGVLPDLIALNQEDLRRAARAGLVRPLTELVPALTTPEWYDFAVSQSTIEGFYAGVPFAGEAMILAYNVNYFASPPRTWDDILAGQGPFLFPAGDASALFTIAEYFSLGGRLQDEAGQVRLDAAVLSQVLDFYQRGAEAGVIPRSLPFASAHETWRAYREARAIAVTTPATTYLSERRSLSITATGLLPTRDGTPVALAQAWSWALVTAHPDRQALALQLLDWLTEPQRLGEWTYAAGVLPTRSSALRAWPTDPSTAVVSGVVSMARSVPNASVLSLVGPAIQTAVQDVLAGRATPEDAANAAAASVANR